MKPPEGDGMTDLERLAELLPESWGAYYLEHSWKLRWVNKGLEFMAYDDDQEDPDLSFALLDLMEERKKWGTLCCATIEPNIYCLTLDGRRYDGPTRTAAIVKAAIAVLGAK